MLTMLNTSEVKSLHNIMVHIDIVRYTSVLNIIEKYPDACVRQNA